MAHSETGVVAMKVKFILAAALVAMFAIPGTASQLAVRSSASLPLIGPVPAASTAGLFSDPNAALGATPPGVS